MKTKTITLSVEQWLMIDNALEHYGESIREQIDFLDEDEDTEDIEELESEISEIDEIQNSIMDQSKNI